MQTLRINTQDTAYTAYLEAADTAQIETTGLDFA